MKTIGFGIGKGRPGNSTTVVPSIVLSANTVIDDAIVGTSIGTFAVASGTGVYTFTITSDVGEKFTIDILDHPTLVTAGTINYDVATTHDITVEADNGVDAVVTKNYTIYVTDVVEPTINLSALTISEDAGVGDEVGILSVTDGYGGYEFSITVDADDKFVVSPEYNTVLQLKDTLNYATASSHAVTIQADNGLQTPSTQEFTITVIDEAEPTIVLSASTIAENAIVGALVANLSVINGSGSYTFSITTDTDNKFVLDVGDNTRLELENTVDYEVATFHSVTLSASNGVDAAVVGTFTINVTDVVDGGALVNLSLDNLDVDENTPFGTVIGAITGYAVGSVLTMTDSAGGRFELDGTGVETGLILTDYSTATSHDITITEVLANAPNSPHDTTFTITVNNVAPVLSALTVTPVAPAYTTATISISTTDGDGTMSFVIVPTAAATPNAAQIVAGTDGSGNGATWADDVVVSGIDTYMPGPTGLVFGEYYDCYVVQYDASSVVSNIVTVEFLAGDAITKQFMLGTLIPTLIYDDGEGRNRMSQAGFVATIGSAAAVAEELVPGDYMLGSGRPQFILDDLTGREAQHGTTFINGAS